MTISSFYNPNAAQQLSKLRRQAFLTFPSSHQRIVQLHITFQETLLSSFENQEELLSPTKAHFLLLGYREGALDLEKKAISYFWASAQRASFAIERSKEEKENHEDKAHSFSYMNKAPLGRAEIIEELSVLGKYKNEVETIAICSLAGQYAHRLTLDIIKEAHPEYFENDNI